MTLKENIEQSRKSFPCTNCDGSWQGEFCQQCGQQRKERFTLAVLLQLLIDSFDLEKGFLYNFKELTLNPGDAIKRYLDGYTKPFFNPVKYFLMALGIFVAVSLIFDSTINEVFENQLNSLEISLQDKVLEDKITTFYAETSRDELRLIVVHLVLFVALAFSLTKVYRNQRYIAENLIFVLMIFGHILYFHNLVWIAIMLVKSLNLNSISLIAFVVYFFWGSKQLYEVSWKTALLKGIIAFIFSGATLGLFLFGWFLAQ